MLRVTVVRVHNLIVGGILCFLDWSSSTGSSTDSTACFQEIDHSRVLLSLRTCCRRTSLCILDVQRHTQLDQQLDTVELALSSRIVECITAGSRLSTGHLRMGAEEFSDQLEFSFSSSNMQCVAVTRINIGGIIEIVPNQIEGHLMTTSTASAEKPMQRGLERHVLHLGETVLGAKLMHQRVQLLGALFAYRTIHAQQFTIRSAERLESLSSSR
mmetsp:Transcript_16325/g.49035  ORF Transcript_16325/g.49035 Transcript_16325/m.49035 type:complete len:214 (+) Transcript_16325:240-881(+)